MQQTIKEINQGLIDDNMVNSDKIGSANFFWSFPSKYSEDLKRKVITTIYNLVNTLHHL